MTIKIINGDAFTVLRTMKSDRVQMCVTSPPYFGLRDYGTASWVGGDPLCSHRAPDEAGQTTKPSAGQREHAGRFAGTHCHRCGAKRVDQQIGLEQTPTEYVNKLVEIFREVRRVLKPDGTLWLNLGDSYANDGKWGGHTGGKHASRLHGGSGLGREKKSTGLKPKDLIGIPWRVAFALQQDGWYLRQDIIWCLSGGTWIYARTPTKIGPMMLKDLVRLGPATVELWNGERWTRVLAWTKRKGREGAREMVLRSGERVGCTNNHVWPTSRGNIRTDEIRRGDIIQTTRLPTGDRSEGWLTPEAFWFAGLYLAEGSRSGSTIQISGHIKEENRLAKLRDLVVHYGGSARAYNHKGKSQDIHIDSAGLSAVIDALIGGRTANDKHLHPAAWQYRDWALKELVRGYLDGDGARDGTRIRLGFCRNYSLERDLRTLAARLGATLTLKPSMAKSRGKSFPAFRGEWRWGRSGHHNERDRGEVMDIRRSRARQFWDVCVADYPNLFALASGVLTHNSKPNPMPESVRDRCTKSHEYLFMFSKQPKYYFDSDAVKEPMAASSFIRLAQDVENQIGSTRVPGKTNGNMKAVRAKGNARTFRGGGSYTQGRSFDNSIVVERESHGNVPNESGLRNRRSVWTISTKPFKEAHFATFPPDLVEPCILAGAPQYAAVLDPFAGSGTVGMVANKLSRHAILIELNPAYCEMAARRCNLEQTPTPAHSSPTQEHPQNVPPSFP